MLATCNRIEIYTDVDRFHGSVEAICRALCDLAGQPTDDVVPHLYVHYDDGAISHLFHVAAGLDSMVVGEGQILGQAREALRLGQELGTVGPALNAAFQQALRVAKRTHAETGIDRAAPSLVSVSLEPRRGARRPARRQARASSSAPARWPRSPSPRCRGSALAEIVVVNRTAAKAARLAEQYAGRDAAARRPRRRARRRRRRCSPAPAPSALVLDRRRGPRRPRRRRRARWRSSTWRCPHDVDPAVAELPGRRS